MIQCIDHFVLTVESVDVSCRFYERVLLFERYDLPGKPTALKFGHQKINLHQVDSSFEPRAAKPTPGAGDFCLITDRCLTEVLEHLNACGVEVELGPISRNGANGPMTSIYFRDPDWNLVEVSRYDGQ